MLPITDIHVNLQQKTWLQAYHMLLNLVCINDKVKDSELSFALQFTRKTSLVELATLILLLIGAGNIFVPDYFLKFVDSRTDLSELYENTNFEEMELFRRQSSFTKEKDPKKLQKGGKKGSEIKEVKKVEKY